MKLAFVVAAVAGVATLWMAVVADTGASVIVIANALRLLRAD
jgi:Cd2+/Zn2+-exporting ATPase